MEEVDILCDVKAFMIIFNSENHSTSASASGSRPDFWVPPPSPEEEVHLLGVGFSDEDDHRHVHSLVSTFHKLAMETTDLLLGPSFETRTGLVDSHDHTAWDQLAMVSELMNDSPKSDDVASAEVNALVAELEDLVENPFGNESNYAFALHDDGVGGGDQSREGQPIVLHKLDIGGNSNSMSPDTQFGNLEGGQCCNDTSDAATGERPNENVTEVHNEPLIPLYFFFP